VVKLQSLASALGKLIREAVGARWRREKPVETAHLTPFTDEACMQQEAQQEQVRSEHEQQHLNPLSVLSGQGII